MFKSLIAALALSAIALAGFTGSTLAQNKPCYSTPKSNVPCSLTSPPGQLPKHKGA